MEKVTQILLANIDETIRLAEKQPERYYTALAYEAEHLILEICGEESHEYYNFKEIKNKIFTLYSTKTNSIIGILKALKNKILLKESSNIVNKNVINLLHNKIYDVAYRKYLDGYYSDAVESAIKEINSRCKSLYTRYMNKEIDGCDLFSKIFNDEKEKTILVAGNDLETMSGKDEQAGYRFLFMGLWKGIRNPKAHANTILTQEQALERLLFCSMLMNKLDDCIKRANLSE